MISSHIQRLFFLQLVGLLLGMGYSQQDGGPLPPNTPAPTLQAGDVVIVAIDNDDTFSMAALAPISAGTVIKVTDDGWVSDNDGFAGVENIFTFTASEDIAKGDVIHFVQGQEGWSDTEFDMEGSEQIFVYQDNSGTIDFISATTKGAGFDGYDGTEESSSLPGGLPETATFVNTIAEGRDGIYYNGTTSGTKDEILGDMRDTSNWVAAANIPYNDQNLIEYTISAGGDPHLMTWSGQRYDYHGACELVLLHSPFYSKGKGLSVHIRTKISTWFSFISNVVVQIGKEVIEFALSNDIYLNKKKVNSIPNTFASHKLMVSTEYPDQIHTVHHYDITLIENQQLNIMSMVDSGGYGMFFVSMKNVRFDIDDMINTMGLMGDFKSGDLVSRDGQLRLSQNIMSVNTIVESWQVKDKSLFNDDSFEPLYPQSCMYPARDENLEKYMMDDDELLKKAKEECGRFGNGMTLCVEDVMRTKDLVYAVHGVY